MARKAKSPKAQPETRSANPAKSVTLIVRRGAQRRFDKLAKATKNLPATVSWDRRLGERRVSSAKAGPERRRNDRRKPPPFSWEVADFLVVCAPSVPDADPEEG